SKLASSVRTPSSPRSADTDRRFASILHREHARGQPRCTRSGGPRDRSPRPWAARARSPFGLQSAREGTVAEQRHAGRWLAWITIGLIIGVVEAIFAMAFAALVFGGRVEDFIAEGISLY